MYANMYLHIRSSNPQSNGDVLNQRCCMIVDLTNLILIRRLLEDHGILGSIRNTRPGRSFVDW